MFDKNANEIEFANCFGIFFASRLFLQKLKDNFQNILDFKHYIKVKDYLKG